MPEVPPQVLSWLYSILQAQYHEVDRTYQDVGRVLQNYPLIKPRTQHYVYPNGREDLLLLLDGLIPVVFRGQTYNFPINVWVPIAYPREQPIIFAVPTADMLINPGQHVDPNGQVYHPYLSNWKNLWDKSALFDFIAILRDVFAKEPPVKAKARGPPQAAQPQAAPPPIPPLPPDLAPRPASQVQSPAPTSGQQGPPPPPPKWNGEPLQQHASPTPGPSQQARPPSLPPLPPKQNSQSPAGHQPAAGHGGQPGYQQHQQPQYAHDPRASQYGLPEPQGPPIQIPPQAFRYDSAPHLPAQAQGPMQPGQQYAQQGPPPPGQPPQGYFPPGAQHWPPSSGISPPMQPRGPLGPADPRHSSMMTPPQPQYQQQPGPPPGWQPMPQKQPPPPQPQAQPPLQPQQPKAPPPPDLMDADDLSLSIPTTQSMTPPPIPPNPEKDMLLRQLASTLHSMRINSRNNMSSSLSGLEAQKKAMSDARMHILDEMQQLTLVSQMLQKNTSILHSTMQRADEVIENSKAHPQPDIDSLLIAPSIVTTQLYNLVTEERALGDTVFMLGRAVERGRVAPNVFAKTTRSLARDWFLKKALIHGGRGHHHDGGNTTRKLAKGPAPITEPDLVSGPDTQAWEAMEQFGTGPPKFDWTCGPGGHIRRPPAMTRASREVGQNKSSDGDSGRNSIDKSSEDQTKLVDSDEDFPFGMDL
ncbi:hypothetical protein MKZ38_005165 [Zalerion maritima]|uniref:Uncharacterized protein n=1 Tax=Zalerion maritima TaxID=339359 RepID=A0AAD5WW84_9PEZI|nr:hypothetical protein MKZ38_005165 [Zalerion maritima]